MKGRSGRTNMAGLTTAVAPLALALIYMGWMYFIGADGRQAALHPSAVLTTINPLTQGLLLIGNAFLLAAFVALLVIRVIYQVSSKVSSKTPETAELPRMKADGLTFENVHAAESMLRALTQMHVADRRVMNAILGNEQERAAGANALLAQARQMIRLGRSDEGNALLTALSELSTSNDVELKKVAREASEEIAVNQHH